VSVGRGGYMAVVGQKDVDARDWWLAWAAVESEAQQAFDLGNRLRLYGFCRGPSSQPVAIVAYDDGSVY
jgi:hypothetical protein